MADQHGQGAYIVMHDFKGLDNKDIQPALDAFHHYIDGHKNKSATGMEYVDLPYSKPGTGAGKEFDDMDVKSQKLVQRKVAEKIALAYSKFHSALTDEDQGGYDAAFLEAAFQHTPEDFADLLGVMLPRDEKVADKLDNDRGFKTDDEMTDDDDEAEEEDA